MEIYNIQNTEVAEALFYLFTKTFDSGVECFYNKAGEIVLRVEALGMSGTIKTNKDVEAAAKIYKDCL